MILTPVAVTLLARNAGFPPDVATTMTAIARRESGFDPSKHNDNPATGDDSYGLWQINWRVPEIRALLESHGIANPLELFDGPTCARAAYLLYGGKLANLKIAWYIDRPGYKERYESHLPEAQNAALEVTLVQPLFPPHYTE